MKKYHIVADGFSVVKATSYKASVFSTPDKDAFLEDFIDRQRRASMGKGGSFYDGDIVGLLTSSVSVNGNEVNFETQRIKYSQHAGLFRGDANSPIQAMYVSGLLVTSDNRIVLGTTQATEADWMGRLGIPAGALNVSPDGFPSLGAQIYREISEEIGIAPDYMTHDSILPGWINSTSTREHNYHFTTSFVVPIILAERQMREFFGDWKHAQESIGRKTEFKDVKFLPNDPHYIDRFAEDQDRKGRNADLLGKSLDVIEEWATKYGCDPEKLKASKTGAKIYI